MINKRPISKVLITIILLNLLLMINPLITYASKTKLISFSSSMSRTRSQTITIPNLKSVDSISVNTGNVSYSINGDQVTINVSNGTATSSSYNSTKYSKPVTGYRTSSSNSFSSTYSYSDGSGYSGTLGKSGGGYVISGSSGSSKNVSGSRTTSAGGNPSSLPSSVSYNNGTYSGTLYGGSATVISGSEGQTLTKPVTLYETSSSNSFNPFKVYPEDSQGYSGVLLRSGSPTKRETGRIPGDSKQANKSVSKWIDRSVGGSKPAASYFSNSIGYNSGGYTGTLYLDGYAFATNDRRDIDGDGEFDQRRWIGVYVGTVSKPDTIIYEYRQKYASAVSKTIPDTRVWRKTYSGTVTKPDTRVWRQNYSGTAYKGGTDYYYTYNVTLQYTDNREPQINVDTISNNTRLSENLGFNEIGINNGTVKDEDIGDIVAIKYTILDSSNNPIPGHEDVTIQSGITANGNNQSFNNHTIIIDDTIHEGNYTLKIIVEDDKGGTDEAARTFTVDKTGPAISANKKMVVPLGAYINIDITATDSSNPSNDIPIDYIFSHGSFSGNGVHTVNTGKVYIHADTDSSMVEGEIINIDITAKDSLNNISTDTVKIKIDSTGVTLPSNL